MSVVVTLVLHKINIKNAVFLNLLIELVDYLFTIKDCKN